MSHARQFSVEISPLQGDQGRARLQQVITGLQAMGPEFVSVTYGAGGATEQASLAALEQVQAAGAVGVPHLSAIGMQRASVRALLAHYRTLGVRRLVILRGDAPSGQRGTGDFLFASDLVRFIRAECGARLHLDVAAFPECHPQARNSDEDLRHFKAKVEAGADSAITQYFFNPDAYADFIERCAASGITIPIVPGIMPIGSFSRLVGFSEARGIEFPRWIRMRMAAYGDDKASIRALGIELAVRLCERLLTLGAPGLHFFSLNDDARVAEIWRSLNLPSSGTGTGTAAAKVA